MAGAITRVGSCRNSFREVAAYDNEDLGRSSGFRYPGLISPSYSPRLPAPWGSGLCFQRISSPVTAARLRRIFTVLPLARFASPVESPPFRMYFQRQYTRILATFQETATVPCQSRFIMVMVPVHSPVFSVIPAKGGIQYAGLACLAPDWIPPFAGMTWKWKCYFASIPYRTGFRVRLGEMLVHFQSPEGGS